MARFLMGWLMLLGPALAGAADVTSIVDEETGWKIIQIKEGNTVAKVCREAGCNLYSIQYKGRELLRTPPRLKELPGFMYGTPLLYPTPNRVRDSKLTFDGKTYSFTPNNGRNFLHGLVHNVAWQEPAAKPDADNVIAAE